MSAQLLVDSIRENTRHGFESARSQGRIGARPTGSNPEHIEQPISMRGEVPQPRCLPVPRGGNARNAPTVHPGERSIMLVSLALLTIRGASGGMAPPR